MNDLKYTMPFVLVRLVALFFFMRIFSQWVYSLLVFSVNLTNAAASFSALSQSMHVFICIMIFCYPRIILIGLKVGRDGSQTSVETVKFFQSVGISLIGLQHLIHAALVMTGQWSLGGQGAYDLWNDPRILPVIQVLSGAVLIIWSSGLTKLFFALRTWSPNVETRPEEVQKFSRPGTEDIR